MAFWWSAATLRWSGAGPFIRMAVSARAYEVAAMGIANPVEIPADAAAQIGKFAHEFGEVLFDVYGRRIIERALPCSMTVKASPIRRYRSSD